MTTSSVLLRVVPLALALSFTACTPANSAYKPAAGASASSQTIRFVRIQTGAFLPAILRVSSGTVVRWRNLENRDQTIVSEGKPSINSKPFAPGKNYNYRFTKAGVVKYRSGLYPDMQGTIEVTE
ncbi:MAG: hypothetical protein PHW10_00470 [Candidatus Peribacteraceae bacterium]|nr:hypothetical protein [Candidatus Peribacteraceae bacterium]